MRGLACLLLLSTLIVAQQLPHDDAVRIAEFYRFAGRVQDGIWPDWSKIPAPLLLVTEKEEFLIRHPAPPQDFKKISQDVYSRPRQFDIHLLATFLAFGPPSVMVVGEPANTEPKTSTPWIITLMHEHFHQLQNAQPEYFARIAKLGLSGDDKTGMWMLNYPFPYTDWHVVRDFAHLRDLLLKALNTVGEAQFRRAAGRYIAQRRRVFKRLNANDHKYLSFQLWDEGIARYTQIKTAEAAVNYRPAPEYESLADYQPFSRYAAQARNETFNELKQANLAIMKRTFVYPFGAAEGLLLDRLKPHWKEEYFNHPLSTDALFQPAER
jgi:hypothetical protein